MICRYCKRSDIPENAPFCCWCGKKLVKDRQEIKVPDPTILPSGTYFGRVTVNGVRKSISAPTEAEYFVKARAAKTELIEIKKAPPKMTLEEAINDFIKANDKVLSPSSIKGYKSMAKTRFLAYQQKDISSIDYQRMVNDELNCMCGEKDKVKKISPKTVANAYRLVTASLKHAKKTIPDLKLPEDINLAQISKATRPWLDYEQIQIFLDAVKGKDCELAALLALNGLRRSELLHLTAGDIDLDKKLIHVNGASVYNADGEFIAKKTNKNDTSQRTVHIAIPRLEDLLRDRTGVLVTSKPNTTYVAVNRICEAAGLPQVGVHGLRHSFASLAYHLKWSEATVMREGGWSNTKTVHEIYTHLADQDANEDIQKMRDFFNGNGAKTATENPTK